MCENPVSLPKYNLAFLNRDKILSISKLLVDIKFKDKDLIKQFNDGIG